LLPLQALEGSAGRVAAGSVAGEIQPKIDTSMKFISLHVQLQLGLCVCGCVSALVYAAEL